MCTIYDPYLQIFSPHQEQHPVSAGLLGDAAQSLRDVRGRHLGDGTAWHHGTAWRLCWGELEAITEFAHVQKMKDGLNGWLNGSQWMKMIMAFSGMFMTFYHAFKRKCQKARGWTHSVCKDADDAVKRYSETDQVPCLASSHRECRRKSELVFQSLQTPLNLNLKHQRGKGEDHFKQTLLELLRGFTSGWQPQALVFGEECAGVALKVFLCISEIWGRAMCFRKYADWICSTNSTEWYRDLLSTSEVIHHIVSAEVHRVARELLDPEPQKMRTKNV